MTDNNDDNNGNDDDDDDGNDDDDDDDDDDDCHVAQYELDSDRQMQKTFQVAGRSLLAGY